jgi:putative DNA primase/helicase
MDHKSGRVETDYFYPGAEAILLRETKAPVSWDTYSLSEVDTFDHVGIKMTEPWVVVDVDDMEQAEKLTALVEKEEIRCRIMQTTKGRHFWFRAKEPMKNSVRSMTGIGIHADYRSWGKQAQVCVKLHGEWREWIHETAWEDIEEIPRWLRPLRQDKWKFYEMGDGDGRNSALFAYQTMLADRGYSHEEASEVIRMINQYVLKEPLTDSELSLITRPAAYPEPKVEDEETGETFSEDSPWFVVNKNGTLTFKHNIMGDYLGEILHALTYHNQMYVYQDGYYQPGENIVLRKIIELYPESKKANRAEVVDYMKIQKYTDVGDTEEYTVNVRNGRLNLKTFELTEHSPDHIDFQRVNAIYDPTCIDFALENMLWKVFCDDNSLYKLFEEMVGYTLVRNCRYQKMFVFSGEGSNGKSTVIRMLKHFLGERNVATLSLQSLEDKFKVAELENRLANLGDDISSLTVKDSSLMKKLTSGDSITVERKNQDPFTLVNYAKLIFSTNKMPNVADQSHGLGRRLCIIPFDATFSPSDPDYDANIEEKVMTDNAMSYLLNIAIRGLKRLAKNGRFTEPTKVRNATESFRVANNNVLTWLADEEKTAEDLVGCGTKAVYQEYRLYCESNGMHCQSKKGVTQTINKEFGLCITPNQRITGGMDRLFTRA